MRLHWLLLLCVCAAASAQTIYKCKGPDGKITYSSVACPDDGAPLGKSMPAPAPEAKAAKQEPAAVTPGALPKQCDNGPALKTVVATLNSPSTPDDVRAFLADERFRLMRCEIVRLTPDERRQREAAMAELGAKDPARRQAAIARTEALYARYLTQADRAARLSR